MQQVLLTLMQQRDALLQTIPDIDAESTGVGDLIHLPVARPLVRERFQSVEDNPVERPLAQRR
jgi:hypothetical protein